MLLLLLLLLLFFFVVVDTAADDLDVADVVAAAVAVGVGGGYTCFYKVEYTTCCRLIIGESPPPLPPFSSFVPRKLLRISISPSFVFQKTATCRKKILTRLCLK